MVKKNKTPFRASMGFNTLRSILTVKLANPNGKKVNPDKALLKSAKSATCEYTVIKDTRFPHHPFPQKKLKNDVIGLLLAVYFYLYIFSFKHDEGSDTKQISRFFIIPSGWIYMPFPLKFLKFRYIIHTS